MRAGLIVADAAGSGLFRQGMKIQAFIEDAFANTKRLDFKAVARKVIQPRKRELKRKDLWRGWNDFQRACGIPKVVPSRALLLAPCGSGKTLAAWRWIADRCGEQSRGPARSSFIRRGERRLKATAITCPTQAPRKRPWFTVRPILISKAFTPNQGRGSDQRGQAFRSTPVAQTPFQRDRRSVLGLSSARIRPHLSPAFTGGFGGCFRRGPQLRPRNVLGTVAVPGELRCPRPCV